MFADIKYELTRGFAYRRIEHEHQAMYSRVLPLVGGILATALYIAVPDKIAILGKDGLLSSLLSIIATLPGFYFAGLAAVATFGGADMDKDMPAPAPELKMRHKGNLIKTTLSRRKYMSYIFSYLVVLSFMLCGIIVALNTVQPTINDLGQVLQRQELGWLVMASGETGVVFLISVLSASVAVTTLQGLFFLSERLHQP